MRRLCIISASCRKSVDFPMPGSPATSTKLPGTIPPPSTRFSSSSFEMMRSCSFVSTSFISMLFEFFESDSFQLCFDVADSL